MKPIHHVAIAVATFLATGGFASAETEKFVTSETLTLPLAAHKICVEVPEETSCSVGVELLLENSSAARFPGATVTFLEDDDDPVVASCEIARGDNPPAKNCYAHSVGYVRVVESFCAILDSDFPAATGVTADIRLTAACERSR